MQMMLWLTLRQLREFNFKLSFGVYSNSIGQFYVRADKINAFTVIFVHLALVVALGAIFRSLSTIQVPDRLFYDDVSVVENKKNKLAEIK